MGVVYRAYQPSLDRDVALKVLPSMLVGDSSMVRRFLQEARVAAKLDHPHIVPIYDVGEADGHCYIAMRLVPGETLADLLDREQQLPGERVRQLLGSLADALDFAHAKGIVHRDLKPRNVMIEPGNRVTLLDFGIAHAMEGTRLTRSGGLMGTPHYMAPEVVQGAPASAATDRYALGILAYELLAGRPPFTGATDAAVLHAHAYETPPPLRPRQPVAPSMEQAVMRMLAKEPGKRWPTCATFVSALGAISPQPAEALRRNSRSRARVVAPLAAAVISLALVGLVLAAGRPGTINPAPSLVKGTGTSVYLIDNGVKRWIPDMETLQKFGHGSGDIRVVSPADLDGWPVGEPLRADHPLHDGLVLQGSDASIYLTKDGAGALVPDLDTLSSLGHSIQDVARVPDSWLNSLSKGRPIASIHATPTPRPSPSVPEAPRDGSRSFIVRDGDSISTIAAAVYDDPSLWRLIFDANRDVLPTESQLQVGQTLRIPPLPTAAVQSAAVVPTASVPSGALTPRASGVSSTGPPKVALVDYELQGACLPGQDNGIGRQNWLGTFQLSGFSPGDGVLAQWDGTRVFCSGNNRNPEATIRQFGPVYQAGSQGSIQRRFNDQGSLQLDARELVDTSVFGAFNVCFSDSSGQRACIRVNAPLPE